MTNINSKSNRISSTFLQSRVKNGGTRKDCREDARPTADADTVSLADCNVHPSTQRNVPAHTGLEHDLPTQMSEAFHRWLI